MHTSFHVAVFWNGNCVCVTVVTMTLIGGLSMRLTNSTTSKVLASIAVWFVVFLILVFGGFEFSSAEDWRWTTLGGVLLAAAAVVSVLICSCSGGTRRA